MDALAYAESCEDGASPWIASPVMIGSPRHFLVDHQGIFDASRNPILWTLWPHPMAF